MQPPSHKPPGGNDPVETKDVDWRESLLIRIRYVAVALVFLGGAATLVGFRSEPMRIFGAVLMIHSIIMIGLLWARAISPIAKSIIIIASLGAASVVAYLIAGYLPGGAMTGAFVLVLAVLLIGRTTFIIALLAYTLFLIALLLAIATGVWQGPNPIDLTPADPTNWFRTGLVTVLLWASIGFSVSFVVSTIENNLARRRAALVELENEIAERRVAENARRKAEAVANQAQKLDAVGQLAAGIAHDFNNALLVIQGWNDMRGKTDATEQQREATRAIEQATAHTAQLSRQLLTFARKDVRMPRYLRLDQFVEQTANTLRHLVGAHVELQVDCQSDSVIHVDESQMQQLLFNLVINARDALEDRGTIRVSVRAAADSNVDGLDTDTHRWVTLEVEDDGPGIEEVVQKRVFEPFFTTKPPGKGTGLGLSTAFGIVEQNGGSIKLESRPGRTRFSINLPTADIDDLDLPIEPGLQPESVPAVRTLVLEDDSLARHMIVTVLERNGNDVVECDSGDAAMALLRDDPLPFDLLCSDAVFPGAQLETILETFERHSPDAKVLICSGYVQQELAIRKLESGEYAFLAKPFTGRRLLARINETLLDTGSRK